MNRPRCSGFTLLELLVVMFIVGIIAAMATLSIGVATSEKGTEKEVERLGDLLGLASEESVLQGREFGLTFYAREYVFSAYDPATASWEPLGADAPMLAPRKLPPDSVLELQIDGRNVKLLDEPPKPAPDDDAQQDGTPEADGDRAVSGTRDGNMPQVFILSSGDVTPFTVYLRPGTGQPGIRLEVADNGATKQVRDEI